MHTVPCTYTQLWWTAVCHPAFPGTLDMWLCARTERLHPRAFILTILCTHANTHKHANTHTVPLQHLGMHMQAWTQTYWDSSNLWSQAGSLGTASKLHPKTNLKIVLFTRHYSFVFPICFISIEMLTESRFLKHFICFCSAHFKSSFCLQDFNYSCSSQLGIYRDDDASGEEQNRRIRGTPTE